MSVILATLLKWLQGKLGAFFGWAIYTLIKPYISLWWSMLNDYWEKLHRDKKQKKAKEKLEDNVKKEKPRDEGTRKDEEDWLNS